MGLLPWSVGFSIIVALLCWSQFGKLHEDFMLHTALLESVQSRAEALYEEIGEKADNEFTHHSGGEKPEHNRNKHHRAPTHSPLTKKLHISALVSSGGGNERETQRILFYRLITILYGNQPLFHEGKNTVEELHALFDELFEQILQVEDKFAVKKAEMLGNIEFTGLDKHKKELIRFLILRGGKGEIYRKNRCDLPALGKFIETRKRQKVMSVYLAPTALLLALFQDEEVVKKVLKRRVEIYHQLAKESKSKEQPDTKKLEEDLKLSFQQQFEPSIPSDIDPLLIDFDVSTTLPKEMY